MSHSFKCCNCFVNDFYRHSCIISHGTGCHHIFIVMLPQKFQFPGSDHFYFFLICPKQDSVSIQENPLFQFPYTGKENWCCRAVLCILSKLQIFIIQDTVAVLCLMSRNQFLHSDILFHGVMAVQMILCDVQDSRNIRRKVLCCFQLKTADFSYCTTVFCHRKCSPCISISDIAHNKDRIIRISGFPVFLHDFS